MEPIDYIDYAEGIDCPDNYDDEQALMDFVIRDDCELCYLDTYMRESMNNLDQSINDFE